MKFCLVHALTIPLYPESKKHWKKVCITKHDKLTTEEKRFVQGGGPNPRGVGGPYPLVDLDWGSKSTGCPNLL